jgi:hypothetical protein
MSGVGTTFDGFGTIIGGALDSGGNIVANPAVKFEGAVKTEGSGNSINDLTYVGSVCGPLCGNTKLNAEGLSQQKTTATGQLMTTTTALPIGFHAGGSSMAMSEIQFGYHNGSGTTTTETPSSTTVPSGH